MLAIILFVGVFFLGYLADNEAKKANEEVRKVFNDTFKTVPNKLRTTLTTNPDDLKKFINNKNKELEDKLKLASKGKQSMISLVRQISESFPPDVKVDVNVLSIDQKTLRLDGVLYSGTLDKVKEALGKIPNFNNIKLELEGQRFVFRGEVLTK
jgi:hypothetical protein